MNFLAHLWLAERTRTSPAGAVLGDWLRGRVPDDYPPELRTGVLLHRRVDVLTDAHPAIVSTRQRFAAGRRRYAGILLDLVVDHLLARRWPEFSDVALAEFARSSALDVQRRGDWFRQAGGFVPQADEFEKLLLSYREPAGIERAIRRTAQRLRKPEGLLALAEDWPAPAAALEPRLAGLLADLAEAAVTFARSRQSRPPETGAGSGVS